MFEGACHSCCTYVQCQISQSVEESNKLRESSACRGSCCFRDDALCGSCCALLPGLASRSLGRASLRVVNQACRVARLAVRLKGNALLRWLECTILRNNSKRTTLEMHWSRKIAKVQKAAPAILREPKSSCFAGTMYQIIAHLQVFAPADKKAEDAKDKDKESKRKARWL